MQLPGLAALRPTRELLESSDTRWPALILFCLWLIVGVVEGYWSKGVFFALGWLALASYLIRSSRDIAISFVDDLEVICPDQSAALATFSDSLLGDLKSNRFLYFSLPFLFAIVALVEFSDIFPEGLPTLLAALTLGWVFVYAGKGFWGVYAAVRGIYRMTRLQVCIDPFYPDGKGGFTIADDFLNKIGWYFFSGGLLLPMAFEIGRDAETDVAKALVAAFLVIFFVTGVTALVAGKIVINQTYESARRLALRKTSRQMRALITEGGEKRVVDAEAQLQSRLEKLNQPGLDRYRFFGLLPQVLTASVPLATYGEASLWKFATDVFAIFAQT